MKIIGITQRVGYVERINERRDMLDQRWYTFADEIGIQLIPIPNALSDVHAFVEHFGIEGLIFSGGNNVGQFSAFDQPEDIRINDVATERDYTEKSLLAWAIEQHRPVVGVCRGFQCINVFFGGTLVPVDGDVHIAKTHRVAITGQPWEDLFGESAVVNSYHARGITEETLGDSLIPRAYWGKEVEAFEHPTYRISGMMWHPEREAPFAKADIAYLKRTLAGEI